MGNLSATLAELGQHEASNAMKQQVGGNCHLDRMLPSLSFLPLCYRRDVPMNNAAFLLQVLALCTKIHGPEHADTIASMCSLALTLDALGEDTEVVAIEQQVCCMGASL